MCIARGNRRRRQKRAKKNEQKKTEKLLAAFRQNDTVVLDCIYLQVYYENQHAFHLFTQTNEEGVVRKFDLPEPMNYWNACKYANKILDEEDSIY